MYDFKSFSYIDWEVTLDTTVHADAFALNGSTLTAVRGPIAAFFNDIFMGYPSLISENMSADRST